MALADRQRKTGLGGEGFQNERGHESATAAGRAAVPQSEPRCTQSRPGKSITVKAGFFKIVGHDPLSLLK